MSETNDSPLFPDERQLLPSDFIASQLKRLDMIGRELRSNDNPEFSLYADELEVLTDALKKVVIARGDRALLQSGEELHDVQGGRAIHIPTLPGTEFMRTPFPLDS